MSKLTEYLHTAAAAEYLGVAQNTIRKWAARSTLGTHPSRTRLRIIHETLPPIIQTQASARDKYEMIESAARASRRTNR